MKISLVCTVKNESDTIDALIESILAQTRRPDEIVINDCGSADDTAARVQRWIDGGAPIRLVSGGFNISSGRNNAIRHASGPIIASTDAGLTLAPDWLERLVGPLERGEAELAGGFSAPAPQSRFETVLGATNYRALEEIDGARFLPAGQCVAFLREVWEAAGGYPEWLDHSEDLVFDRAALAAGYRSAFVPDAVIHFRPRESLRALFRQYFFYARGDGVAGLWPLRHAVRYGTYLGLAALLGLARRRPALLALVPPAAALYVHKPARRVWRSTAGWPLLQRLIALAQVPLIKLVGDVAKLVGYPAGRLRQPHRR